MLDHLSFINKFVVITGSTNKFSKEIYELSQQLRDQGVYVIDDSRFHLLPEEIGRREFMKRILDSDMLLVYNKDQYIGLHTKLEISLAEVAGIRIEYIFDEFGGKR